MEARTKHLIVIGLVALHVIMLAAYTLPSQFVPDKLHVLSVRYVRPLFHQQWHLFAPDPPLCSCALEVEDLSGEWHPLVHATFDPLPRRMARHLAEYVQDGVAEGDHRPLPILQQAIRSMVRDSAGETDSLQFRLVEECVQDPHRPKDRKTRITLLQFDRP